ncbi:MAG: S41 family peptidase, partial [Bacteroidales bacterium]
IGSLIRKSGDYAVISDVYKGFPADLAGFKTGDLIIEIDGKTTKGMAITKISDLLKGRPNSNIRITVRRFGVDDPIQKTLTRERIQIKSVPYYGMMDQNIGYIRLSNFTQNAGKEVRKAVLDLKESHNLSGLILDLRGNPGGLLIEAVEVVNLFVEKNHEVVSTRGKVKDFDHTYFASKDPVDVTIPLTVLVSRTSASASEIVAGAIQDLDRGIIVGERTYGKGLVQTTRPLSYNSQLKLTTAKYYIPSGRCIQALDFSNRNEDGSVGHIPDSLISEYTTKNGRKVYDGGGIVPDVTIRNEKLSQISLELYRQFCLFDYATKFSSEHERIAVPNEFELTEADFRDFAEYIVNMDFKYQTQTEEALKKLEDVAKLEQYYEKAKKEFIILKEKLGQNTHKDMESHKEEIIALLTEEIVGRYYYQEGSIQVSIASDKQVMKAFEIIVNPDIYSILLRTDPSEILAEIE